MQKYMQFFLSLIFYSTLHELPISGIKNIGPINQSNSALVTAHGFLSRLHTFNISVLHFCWPVIMSVFIYLAAMAVNRRTERMEAVLAS